MEWYVVAFRNGCREILEIDDKDDIGIMKRDGRRDSTAGRSMFCCSWVGGNIPSTHFDWTAGHMNCRLLVVEYSDGTLCLTEYSRHPSTKRSIDHTVSCLIIESDFRVGCRVVHSSCSVNAYQNGKGRAVRGHEVSLIESSKVEILLHTYR